MIVISHILQNNVSYISLLFVHGVKYPVIFLSFKGVDGLDFTTARDGKYAVGQFNINNLEWTKAILLTAQEQNSPVILGVSEGAGKYMTGFKTVSAMVKAMIEELNITVPVALHLDHGTYEGCYKCIDAGFSSIMFDGSHYPIAENVEKTKELVKVCAEKGISLEAEVGSLHLEFVCFFLVLCIKLYCITQFYTIFICK